MKKSLLIIVGCLLISSYIMAQVPKLFNYQGVVHGEKGPLNNQAIGIKISIINNAANGTVLYEERHVDTTNNYGLYAIAIGSGSALSGNMDSVNWSSGDKYIKVAIDPDGGTSYSDLGTTQLLSVPYALYAGSSESGGWNLKGNTVDSTAFVGTLNDEDVRFKRNGLDIGRIDTSNTAFGRNALNPSTTGIDNNALGQDALRNNTTGKSNNSLGNKTLYYNTTGADNNALGYLALNSNHTGAGNNALGNSALSKNTRGGSNNALGPFTLSNNKSGYNNNAIGRNALYGNTTGDDNNAIGTNALENNKTGVSNNAIGHYALRTNTTGYNNNAIGHNTLENNTKGNNNSALGAFALNMNTTGKYNIAIGHDVLHGNTTGDYNSAFGYRAGFFNKSGTHLTIIGDYADVADTGYTMSGAFGFSSRVTASNQYRVGSSGTTSIGGKVGWTTTSDGRFKTNVKEDVVGLVFIQQLRPVTYNIDNKKVEDFLGIDKSLDGEEMPQEDTDQSSTIISGFIAQEVEAAAEKLGYDFHGVDRPKNDKDYYGLRYAEFVVPLVKAVQEQQEMIETQNERIDKLEIMLQRLLDERE